MIKIHQFWKIYYIHGKLSFNNYPVLEKFVTTLPTYTMWRMISLSVMRSKARSLWLSKEASRWQNIMKPWVACGWSSTNIRIWRWHANAMLTPLHWLSLLSKRESLSFSPAWILSTIIFGFGFKYWIRKNSLHCWRCFILWVMKKLEYQACLMMAVPIRDKLSHQEKGFTKKVTSVDKSSAKDNREQRSTYCKYVFQSFH